MWLEKRWRANEGQNKARLVEEKLVFNFVVGNVVSVEGWGKYLHEKIWGMYHLKYASHGKYWMNM